MFGNPSKARIRPVIRVFVSSTFSDLVHERNALQDRVWPELERYCQLRGFQFQAIDLRWGIPTEAGLDHRTMRICFEELHRSQEVSPQPNFLILLGDRYGWQPLPEEISEAEFKQLTAAATELGSAAIAALNEWYRRDDNARPEAIYVLESRRQSLGDGCDYTQDSVWQITQQQLWRIINEAFPPSGLAGRFAALDGPLESAADVPAIIRFQGSATE
jgi:uncharacterized protein DUF4062